MRNSKAWPDQCSLRGLVLVSLFSGMSGNGLRAEVSPAPLAEDDTDTLFLKARTLSREGKREEAKGLCRKALARSPEYHEIRIFLGRMHAWDNQYDAGRTELRYVLQKEPANLDAREALIDLESWADQPHQALKVCEEGLQATPGNDVLLYRKAKVLKNLNDFPAALIAAQSAVEVNKGNDRARILRDDLKELNQRNKVSLDHVYESFDSTFDPWRTTSLTGSHRFDFGSVIGRVNRAQRFGDYGTQFEMDAYPKLMEGTYLYLNAGHSSDSIFPKFRSGGEIYHNFPKGIEASLGFRYLKFSESSVTIYTGSIGKYLGDYLLTLRLNATPSSIGSSSSGSVSLRRYLESADSYVYLTLAEGVSPDQPNPSFEVLKLRSRRGGLGLQKLIGRSVVLSAGANLERQELRFNEYRQHRTFNFGVEYRF